MKNSYVVGLRANLDSKEISATARDPEKSGCLLVNDNGRYQLRWNWLQAKNRPELNDWEVLYKGLTREEARIEKAKILKEYTDKGFTIRTVKHYEKQ